MAERPLTVRAPAVIHERLDDEVIAIDLERGTYYAMVGPAADIWTSFTTPASVNAVAEGIAERYDEPFDVVQPAVKDFASRLETTQLLIGAATDGAAGPTPIDDAPTGPWAVPELEVYNDMADLVLLDPIHQVDEAGWPHLPDPEADPKPTPAPDA